MFTFSCATFVHHCYAEALGDPSAIVDIEDLPATADHASDPLFEPLQLRRDVRRLYPAYLMAATLHDEYPFKRWIPTVRFPYQVLALTLRAAGIHEGRLKLAALLGDAGAAHALGGALPDGALSAALGEIADLGSEITVRVLLAAGLGEVGEAAESIRKEIGNWLGSPSQETLQAVSHALRGTSPEVLESAPYTFSAARAAIGETPLSECISQIVTADASLIARVTAVVLPWALGFQE